MFTLQKLSTADINIILQRALPQPTPQLLDTDFLTYLSTFSSGDARTALNLLELSISLATRPGYTKEDIKKALTRTLVYDRAGDMHFDAISAFHKSVRGSDADATVYWLGRMLLAGEVCYVLLHMLPYVTA